MEPCQFLYCVCKIKARRPLLLAQLMCMYLLTGLARKIKDKFIDDLQSVVDGISEDDLLLIVVTSILGWVVV